MIEELEIQIKVESFLMKNIHSYDFGKIKLLSYVAKYQSGEIKHIEHSETKWVNLEELINYDFAPADMPIIEKLYNLSKEKI